MQVISHFQLFLLSLLLCACAVQAKQTPEYNPEASLYERLGGKAAIQQLVEDFYQNVVADERINGFFIGSDPATVNRLLIEQICELTGGPCKYSGRDMPTVHTGMNITEAQFNALVEDLIRSLDKYRVPQQEQQELLNLLASMKDEIINR